MAINEQRYEREDGTEFICPYGFLRFIPLYGWGYKGDSDVGLCIDTCLWCDEHCR